MRPTVKLLASTALASIFAFSHSFAADLIEPDPVPPADPVVAGYNWSGFYAGIGGGSGAVNHEIGLLGLSLIDGIGGEGLFGEVTVGYDHMISDRMLLGAFASYRFGDISTTVDIEFPGFSDDYELTLDHGYDLGARLGFLVAPETLAYATAGYSHQRFSADGFGTSYDWDSDGHFYGMGLESVLTGNWTLKAEYRYTRYDDQPIDPFGLLDVQSTTHTFHAGVNYRFGGGMSSGVSTFAPVNYDFAGLKVGVAGGFGAVVHDIDLDIDAFGPVNAGLDGLGGDGTFGEIGLVYDFALTSNWIVGIGADYRMGNVETSVIGDLLTVTLDHGYDIYGRLGYKINSGTLAYALAGFSNQHFDVGSGLDPLDPIVDDLSWSSHGWTVGGGLETALSDKWTAKIEYRYAEYDSNNILEELGVSPSDATLDITPSTHMVRAGLTYKIF